MQESTVEAEAGLCNPGALARAEWGRLAPTRPVL